MDPAMRIVETRLGGTIFEAGPLLTDPAQQFKPPAFGVEGGDPVVGISPPAKLPEGLDPQAWRDQGCI